VTLAIKGDSFIRGHRVIDYAARRIGEERGKLCAKLGSG
jgi:hypothetical protein